MATSLLVPLLLLLLLRISIGWAWPDGSPCIRAAYESMNPLEAVEHQGGLQLSPPPFYIELKQSCYWQNQPVELTIKGNTTKDQFKGFAMQPFIYQGPNAGQRVGQFLNLDASGSWRHQCFRTRDSATHSHDEKKKKLVIFWKNDREEQSVVQFVATIVVSLRQFWVKSLVSAPLPPCRLQRQSGDWQRAPITPPPPVGRFKIDTFRMFNQQSADFLQNALANERPAAVPMTSRAFPTQPPPSFTAPPLQSLPPATAAPTQRPFNTFVPVQTPAPFVSRVVPPQQQPDARPRLTQPIPLPNMQTNRRPSPFMTNNNQFATSLRPLVSNSTPQFNPQQQQCVDREPANRCRAWISFCSASVYMRNFCRFTCRFC